MKIVQQTTTQLIVQHSPRRVWLGCAFLAIVGLSLFAVPTTSSNEHYVAQISAYITLIWSAIWLLRLGKTVTWSFNQSDNSLRTQSRSLLSTETAQYAFTEISKIRVESVPIGEGEGLLNNNYGIELVLISEQRLHLCPDCTLSDFVAEEGVRRISSFLEIRRSL